MSEMIGTPISPTVPKTAKAGMLKMTHRQQDAFPIILQHQITIGNTSDIETPKSSTPLKRLKLSLP